MTLFRFIADFTYEEIPGGSEAADKEFCELLGDNWSVSQIIKSKDVTVEFLRHKLKHNEKIWYVVSNFTQLNEECKKYLKDNLNYILVEHDFKCFLERHPTRYKSNNYIVPDDQIINREFYKKAKLIIYQTDTQKDIIEKNLNLFNGFSLNGNLFSEKDLSIINNIIDNSGYAHNGVYAIVDDDNPIKGKQDAIKYAKSKNLEYCLISKNIDRKQFLETLRKYKGIILMPTILESCSRLAIEAKLMGLEIISRNCPIMDIDFDYTSIYNCKYELVQVLDELTKEV